ncbi:MAG TPA: D-aminoacyl-tRNA deacylase [Chitinivibrionales bacterium]|nr:D-aminoacyl-tRNA deacylase [Chitinivibrionales bacterium]
MRVVIQRVKKASVSVKGTVTGSITGGLLILVGIHKDDTAAKADYLAEKCANLRIFSDSHGKMNLSLADAGGAALVVSQFTLYGDCAKGRRPSFTDAAGPEKGNELYTYFVEKMKPLCGRVETGVFGAMMDVELVNDGPVTFVLDA